MEFGIQNVKVDLQCCLSDDNSSLNDEDLNSSESIAKNFSDISSTSAMARISKNEAIVPNTQSTASKLLKVASAESQVESTQAHQIQLTSENSNLDSTQSRDIQVEPIMDEKNISVSASQSKEVLGDTNAAMIINEKNNSLSPHCFKAEVKAYVSYSKETMELTKTVQMSTKNGKSIFEGSFNIVKVIGDRDRHGNVHGIMNKDKMKEAVAFCNDPNTKNITVIAKDLAACGGLALFVKGQYPSKKSWNQIHILFLFQPLV